MSSCLNVHPCGCTTAAHLLEESLVTHLMLPAACLQVGVAGLNLAVHHWPATILCIEGHQQNLNRVCFLDTITNCTALNLVCLFLALGCHYLSRGCFAAWCVKHQHLGRGGAF